MPAFHPCSEPLRMEPVTFFIKGPFMRGGLLLSHVFLITIGSLAWLALAMRTNGLTATASSLWWRFPLWIGPPLFHFWFLKKYVEGRAPHYMDDRFRYFLRMRFSFLRPWPDAFPLLPRLVPEADEVVQVLLAPKRRGIPRRYHSADAAFSTHPMLRLED